MPLSSANKMQRPLAILAVFFALGILAASQIKIPFLAAYLLALIFLCATFFWKQKGLRLNLGLGCLVLFLGAASFKNAQSLPGNHILNYLYYKNAPTYLIGGFIDSEPQLKNHKTSFVFKTQAMQNGSLNRICRGDILVHLAAKNDLYYGEELILRGNLSRPFGRRGRGRQGYRDYLSRQGIWLVMNIKTNADIARLKRNRGFILKRLALQLKEKMQAVILGQASSLAAAITQAMVLGEKSNIPWFVQEAMMKTGTVHILVVSGFNVGIVTFMIILFFKLMRIPRKLGFALTIPLLLLYCLLTGASTPVVRATVMAVVFLSGFLLQREPDIYNSLGLAALFILGANPRQLFDIGFQLSFASVISIVYLYPKMKSFFRVESIGPKPLRAIISGGLVSLSAWLGTLGFVAYYFRIFAPVTVLANILIVPLASLITLCGFSLIAAGLICPSLSVLFASTSELLVLFLININTFLLKLPGASFFFS